MSSRTRETDSPGPDYDHMHTFISFNYESWSKQLKASIGIHTGHAQNGIQGIIQPISGRLSQQYNRI